jgi:hypothetical protein
MGQLARPTFELQSLQVGSAPGFVNPLIFIKLDGVVYTEGVRLTLPQGFRNLYGSYNQSTGAIYLNSYTIAVSDTIPELSISGVEVLLID